MTGTLNNQIPARDSGYKFPQYFRASVNFATPNIGSTNGVQIGTLPAGARLKSCACIVDTAFNAATTNVLTVGTSGGSSADIMGSGDITEGTPGVYSAGTGATLTFSVDTPIYAKYTQTGTAATTGAAVIILDFYT
jgi:hypothetical protein